MGPVHFCDTLVQFEAVEKSRNLKLALAVRAWSGRCPGAIRSILSIGEPNVSNLLRVVKSIMSSNKHFYEDKGSQVTIVHLLAAHPPLRKSKNSQRLLFHKPSRTRHIPTYFSISNAFRRIQVPCARLVSSLLYRTWNN
jgi:hypothetical protein